MKKSLLTLAVGATLSTLAAHAGAGVLDSAALAWTHTHSSGSGYLSEILSFDAVRNELWVSGVSGVDVLNASTGAFLSRIDVSAYGSVNSVAISNGTVALAIENKTNRSLPGIVQFYDTATRSLSAGTNTITVGALPDMLTFTKDGSKLLVANEATPNNTSMAGITAATSQYGVRTSASGVFPATFGASTTDPVGSVSIIDMASRTVTATANANIAPRTGSYLRSNAGMDFEPEYIAVNAAGTKAYVSLQEANGMGVLNLQTGQFEKVVGLGAKDFSASGNGIDAKNDSTPTAPNIALTSVNAKGLYMPDGMATYEVNGKTYVVMANEGDFREDDADRTPASNVGGTGLLSNLRVITTESFAGNLVAAGARSFSIRDADGNLVFDSGNILDDKAIALGIYDDGRSRDKGVEPEGVEIMDINGHTIAFIGLERTTTAAVAAFDITDPNNVIFLKMLVANGSISPEGLKGFKVGNDFYLGLSNEVSNTTTAFYLATAVPEPETYALVLAGLGVLAAASRRRRQQA